MRQFLSFKEREIIMTRTKKLTLILLSLFACICVAFGVMQNQHMVQADGLSPVRYEKTYELGETLDVQSATIMHNGEEYTAKAVVRYPSGVKYSVDKIILSEVGVYTVEYTANANGKQISESVSFTVNNDAYTIKGKGSVSYGTNAYLSKDIKGLNVQLSSGATFRYNRVIDLGNNNVNSVPVLRFYTTPETLGVREVDKVTVTLTDAYNPDNFVVVEYKGMRVRYAYVSAGANNQISMGLELLNEQKPGAILYENLPWMLWKNSGFFGNSILGEFGSVTKFELGFNAKEKQIYSNGAAKDHTKKMVIDLDEPLFYGEDLWSGFTTGEAVLSIQASGYASSNFNFFITEIDGEDLSNAEVKNTTPPHINVDFNGRTEESISLHVVGKPYSVFPAVAYDVFGKNVECRSYVYYNYSSSARTLVNVKDGIFTPTRPGVYTLVYKAIDDFGNQVIETINVECIVREKVEAEFGEQQITATVGQTVPIAALDIKNGLNGATVSSVAKLNGSDIEYPIATDSMSFQPFYAGTYTIVYTYTDEIESAEFSYEIDVQGTEKPLFVGDAVVPKFFIKDCTYYIEDYYAYDYSNGTQLIKADVYLSMDGGTEQKLVGNTFKVKNVDATLDVIFKVGSSEKRYSGIVVDANYGKRGKIDFSKYLYAKDFSSESTSEGITYTASDEVGDTTLIELIHYGYLDVFNTQFIVKENADNFDAFSIILTAQRDRTDKIRITYESAERGIIITVSRGEKYLAQGKCLSEICGGQEFKTYVKDGVLCFQGSELQIPVAELFDDFSVKFFVEVELRGITGATAITFKQMMNQGLSNGAYDLVNPIFIGNGFGDNYNIGDSLYISSFDCYDFVDPNPTFYYTVIDENDQFLTADDGTLLDGEQNKPQKEYSVILDRYVVGNLLYVVKDYSGRKDENGFVFQVVDKTPPTITLDIEKTHYNVGDTVKIATAIVEDNSTAATYTVGIIDPDGRLLILSEKSFKATKAGEYTIIYYACDGINNTTFTQYIVRVG